MAKTTKYSFYIFWSEEDEGYIALCPAFQGLSAFGRTEAKALAEAKIVLNTFIEVCKDLNKPLPNPEVIVTFNDQVAVAKAHSSTERARAVRIVRSYMNDASWCKGLVQQIIREIERPKYDEQEGK